jgi:hypothetical protein
MTTLHSRQSGNVRHTRKNGNTGTFYFTSQNAPSICAIMYTKREKSDATSSKSQCSRTTVNYRFGTGHALPLNFVRFSWLANISLMIARSPARWPRAGRATSGGTSGEMSRVVSAQISGSSRAVATAMPPTVRQDDPQDNLPCGKGNGRAISTAQPARRTYSLPRRIPQADSQEISRHVFDHDSPQL